MFSIRIFSIKWRNLFALPFLSPSGLTLPNCRFKASAASRVARSAERGLFKTSPYVAASPCFFLLSQKSAKIVAATRLPPGGRLRREAVVRGASCFLSESFQSSGATCSPFPFPIGLNLAELPFNAIPARKEASVAEQIEPCVFLKNRQSGGKKILAAALIFNRCFRYSGNR